MIAISLVIVTPFLLYLENFQIKLAEKGHSLWCLLAGIAYIPIFKGLTFYGNPALSIAMEKTYSH